MELQQLRYLEALAAEAHFGRAAARCHVSQPALSAGLRRLEAELGVRLVHRAHRFEGLTDEGTRLLRWARATLAAADALQSEAAGLNGELTGVMRIRAIPTVAPVAGRLLAPFLRAHPGVDIELQTGRGEAVAAAVAAHEIDAGLLYTDDPLPPTLSVRRLYRDELVLLSTATGPDVDALAASREVTWEQVARLPLCLLAAGMQQRQLVDRMFAQAGVTVRPRVEADSVTALVDLALAGHASVVARSWITGREVARDASVLPIVGPPVAPTVGLITLAGPLVPRRARALQAALAEVPEL